MNISETSSVEQSTPIAAIVLTLLAGFFFACLDTSGKYLVTNGIPAEFVTWMRFLEHTILAFVLLRAWSNSAVFRTSKLWAQCLRGGLLVGSTFLNFEALKTLQLAQSVTINFASPMMITALAGPLLGEWAGWRRWMAILVGFFGIVIVARPGFQAVSIGFVYMGGSTLSYALYALLTRKMATEETPESLIFFSALIPTVFLSPTIAHATIPADATQWTVLLTLGLFGGISHWMIIQAYRRASTVALAPYSYLQLIWMLLFGYFVFHQLPDFLTVLGAAIIAVSGLYVVNRERRLHLQNRLSPHTEICDARKKL